MVNQSKANDPRFWARWKKSGAVGTTNDTLVSQYKRLVDGEIWDWDGDSIFAFSKSLEQHGLKSEADKLFMNINSVLRMDPEEIYEKLKRDLPEYFAEKIESGAILSRSEQRKLKSADIDAVFERLFDHVTAYGLDILPTYASPATRRLEEEILHAMQTLRGVKAGDLPALRKNLGKRAGIIELDQVGDNLYTHKARKKGDAMAADELEFKVSKATPVKGPRFMATTVGGYHGILKYYLEEVARIAPEEANAYLAGNGILRSVSCKGMWSPIVSGNVLRPINQPDDEYHIVPVKFFNVEVDTSKKYKGDWKEVEWDKEGKPTALRYEVQPVHRT